MCENRPVNRSFPLSVLKSVVVFVSVLSASAQATSARPPLIPQPREFTQRADLSLAGGVRILVSGADLDDRFAAKDLAGELKTRGVRSVPTASALRIWLLRDTSVAARRVLDREHMTLGAAQQAEGYVLVTGPHDVYVIAHTAPGIFYGVQTLIQLERRGGKGPIIQGAAIRDWPAMRWRGVHDDLSRGPVPTLAYQEQQIRTFAAYKLNVYSPYFENTMQYSSNPLPALPGGSMSPADAKALVEYAKPFHITIIPEQEAFGHLHKVLTWQEYAPLAESPMGAVLAPGQPGSMHLITQWFDELATLYPGPFLHIGADETFDLGRGQTADEVKQRGLGAVYVDFLSHIRDALVPLHRRLLFWGDMAMSSPDEVPHIPHDMIAVAWHYEPEPSFARWLDPYTRAGMETWVSPGVNNWNRVWPNFDMALRNIQGFVADGQKAGSTGMLNTVWDDDGEGLFAEDWYAILYGAAASWQQGSSDIARFEQDYGPVFHGDESGAVNQAQLALMAAHQALAKAGLEDARDAQFWADPWSAEGEKIDSQIRPVSAEVRLDAEHALTLLAQARTQSNLRNPEALDAIELGARRIDFLALKFQIADQIAASYQRLYNGQQDRAITQHASRDLWDLAGVNGLCQDLRDGYDYLNTRYNDVWLAENHPYWLNNVTIRYGEAARLWVERGARITAARSQWQQTHTLPAPSEIGIPSSTTAPNATTEPQTAPASVHHEPVATGIDVLEKNHFAELAALAANHHGRLRLGLLTNQTGLDSAGHRTIDVLQHDATAAVPGLTLTTLFSPEHGIAGSLDQPNVANSTDAASGLPVVSLYGPKDQDRRPTLDSLRNLNAVAIDLQDAGVRFYTYEAVVRYFLEAAAQTNTAIVVLDRPNPIGGALVQGPISDPGSESYVNSITIPVRHGMTLGELARYDKEQLHLNVPLTVITMQGWHRGDWYDSTGLAWINPSPNLRSLEEATIYPALGLVEGTNISVGRGTDTPFELFGAPWTDSRALADLLNQRNLPGVRFYPADFTPAKPYPYAGEVCHGVRILVTDRNVLDAPELGIEIASALHRLNSDQFQLQKMTTLLANRSILGAIAAGEDPQKIAQSWRASIEEFNRQRESALLYPN